MADPTKGDTMVLYLDVLVPALIALISGLVINSFIIVINVTNWLNGRSVTPVDLIITSLGISRMCNQCAFTLSIIVSTIFLNNLHVDVTVFIMEALYSFFVYTNIWLTSLLSIVFCLKISNLRTRLFLYLRRMIGQRTVHFIVGSVLLSAMNCLLSLLPTIIDVTKGGTYNTTMEIFLMNCKFRNSFYSHIISFFITLLFCSVSSVLLITSLYRHITKMKMSGNLSINLETYYSAMTFVLITFIYNIIYFTGHMVRVFMYFLYFLYVPWFYTVLEFLPVLHSSYLIYRTAKLRGHMSKVLQNVIDFLYQKKSAETREDIEIVALSCN
ncbi:taste receptor type 2 member 9-like [Hyla sarda]|uniref:taste receptor type 2 member 9-like n=1 Tax=Hyla sarda TaxID=327740 RepID=UPI0024C36439|nr:taste receptor type 2 member 9-like [Hyla sarda]